MILFKSNDFLILTGFRRAYEALTELCNIVKTDHVTMGIAGSYYFLGGI